MQVIFLAVLVIVVLATVFALQNAAPVTVNFLFWRFEGQLSLVLIATFVLGALACTLAALPPRMRKNKKLSQQEKTIRELRDNLADYKRLMTPDGEPPAS